MAYIDEFLRQVEGYMLRGYIPCNRLSDGKGKNYIGPDGTDSSGVQYAATGLPSAFAAMGASGVTIATGVDLGQTSRATLTGYGLTEDYADLYLSYYGKKRNDALQALFEKPFAVSEECAKATDAAVHSGYLQGVIRRYDQDKPKTPFEQLPRGAQAVIFSLLYQNGCAGGPKKNPAAWQALVDGNWVKAGGIFMAASAWQGYQDRRKAEGKLLLGVA
jgi:hypothetical protein